MLQENRRAVIAGLLAGVGLMSLTTSHWWWVAPFSGLAFYFASSSKSTKTRIQSSPEVPRHLTSEVLESFINASPTPTLLLAKNGRIEFANAAIRDLFPWIKVDTAISQNFRAPDFIEAVGIASHKSSFESMTFSTQRKPDHVFEASFKPLDKVFAEILNAHLIIEIMDRTHEKKLEAMRVDFIANASHELRTPLSAIQGGLETLMTHSDDPKAAERFIPIMHKQSQRMERLINDLMSLSKIESQQPLPKGAKADLSKIVQETISLSPMQKFDSTFGKAPVWIWADADQISQALINLIDNAIKYAPSDVITISKSTQNRKSTDQISISIIDQGAGIDPLVIPRLSERFFRVGGQNKDGTGLGLAIVKHIMRRHEGELDIHSKLGEGSTFALTFRKYI